MPSAIERALQAYDRRLRARERAAISRMVRVYGEAWGRVSQQAATLRRRALTEENADGLTARAQWQEEFARLIAQEITTFADVAGGEVLALQSAAVRQAVGDATDLVGMASDGAAVSLMRKPNPAAVQALIGFASDGSPLRELFAGLTGGAPDEMADVLAQGIAEGRNARVIAGELRNRFAVPLTRSLLIARTETHRAYNAATMETYRANDDILSGWIWVSACDRRSCGACFAMHGSRHRMDETLDGHPGCRCKAAPIAKGMRPSKIEPGADRFAALKPELQRQVLGPGKWQAWKDGVLRLAPGGEGSIVQRRVSRQWGSMRTVRSLRDIVGAEGARDFVRRASSETTAAAGIVAQIAALTDRQGVVGLGNVPEAMGDVIRRTWPGNVTRTVVLTGERRQHYLARHPDVQAYEQELPRIVTQPNEVHRNRDDPMVALFYRWTEGGQWLRATVWMSDDIGRQNSVLSFRFAREAEVERARRGNRRVWPQE